MFDYSPIACILSTFSQSNTITLNCSSCVDNLENCMGARWQRRTGRERITGLAEEAAYGTPALELNSA